MRSKIAGAYNVLSALETDTDRVNPRHACAARVIYVVVPFVSMSVCLSTTILAVQASTWLMNDFNSFSSTSARKTKVAIVL